jgi:hypothetical protein
MREIKYRAWDKKRKQYLSDKFISQLFLRQDGRLFWYSAKGHEDVTDYFDIEFSTGLHETTARKKKIYENDKVKCRFWNQIWHEDIVIVKFDPFDGYNLPTSLGGKDHTWEVIGKNHDLELLEQDK